MHAQSAPRRMAAVSRCSSAAIASTLAAADSSSLSSASSRCRRSAAAAHRSQALRVGMPLVLGWGIRSGQRSQSIRQWGQGRSAPRAGEPGDANSRW